MSIGKNSSGKRHWKVPEFKDSHYFTLSEEQQERRTTERIWLSRGGRMLIDHVPPEKHPWDNDDPPLGPQAA